MDHLCDLRQVSYFLGMGGWKERGDGRGMPSNLEVRLVHMNSEVYNELIFRREAATNSYHLTHPIPTFSYPSQLSLTPPSFLNKS